MIILRKYFSNEKEDKKKGVGGALGIAGGSAALGALSGWGFNKMADDKLRKKGIKLREGAAKARIEYNVAEEKARPLRDQATQLEKAKKAVEESIKTRKDYENRKNSANERKLYWDKVIKEADEKINNTKYWGEFWEFSEFE